MKAQTAEEFEAFDWKFWGAIAGVMLIVAAIGFVVSLAYYGIWRVVAGHIPQANGSWSMWIDSSVSAIYAVLVVIYLATAVNDYWEEIEEAEDRTPTIWDFAKDEPLYFSLGVAMLLSATALAAFWGIGGGLIPIAVFCFIKGALHLKRAIKP